MATLLSRARGQVNHRIEAVVVWPTGFCQARGFARDGSARDDNIFKNLRADNRQFIYGVKSLPVEAH
jgi:hypothetical protein